MSRREIAARGRGLRVPRSAVAPLLLSLSCGGGGDAAPPAERAPTRRASPAAGGRTAPVWDSAEACASVLAAGGRLAREPGRIRLATWNLRWFPRGCPPDADCPGQETDVDWVACGIAWMQVDVLAVQEVLKSRDGERGLDALTRALEARSGGRWRSDVQACGEAGAQAVGFVWNAERVTLEDHADLWELNGDRRSRARDACAARLRPGRYARLRGTGGLDASLLVVHLDSGRRELDWERRRRAMARLNEVRVRGRRLFDLDEDVVVLGDFNSMGRGEAPELTPAQEIARLDAELGDAFRRAPPDRACTGYYPRGPGLHARTLLDHVLPAAAMEEAAAGARVEGLCAALDCPESIRGAMPAAFERLSDHCPVLLDLEDRDRDGA